MLFTCLTLDKVPRLTARILGLSVILTTVALSPFTCVCWKSNVARAALPLTTVLRITPAVLSVVSVLPETVRVPIPPEEPIVSVVNEAFPEVIVKALTCPFSQQELLIYLCNLMLQGVPHVKNQRW